jgi:hypothetical protein
MTFPATSATLARTDAGNTFTGGQTISGGTLNGTVLNITQTWGGTGTYTGLQYNVTDSGPSNAASLLMDLQVGGSSQFKITRQAQMTVPTGGFLGDAGGSLGRFTMSSTTPSVVLGGSGTGFFGLANTNIQVPDVFLTRRGAANLRLGAADTTGATAPTPQFLSAQSWASSTTNNQTGANFTIDGSQGTGTGAGGSIIFRVAPAGGVANGVQNALASVFQIGDSSLPRSFTLKSSTSNFTVFCFEKFQFDDGTYNLSTFGLSPINYFDLSIEEKLKVVTTEFPALVVNDQKINKTTITYSFANADFDHWADAWWRRLEQYYLLT